MHVWGDGFQASQLCRYKVVTKKMSENTYGTSNYNYNENVLFTITFSSQVLIPYKLYEL